MVRFMPYLSWQVTSEKAQAGVLEKDHGYVGKRHVTIKPISYDAMKEFLDRHERMLQNQLSQHQQLRVCRLKQPNFQTELLT